MATDARRGSAAGGKGVRRDATRPTAARRTLRSVPPGGDPLAD